MPRRDSAAPVQRGNRNLDNLCLEGGEDTWIGPRVSVPLMELEPRFGGAFFFPSPGPWEHYSSSELIRGVVSDARALASISACSHCLRVCLFR
jgi:hypothetical protein